MSAGIRQKVKHEGIKIINTKKNESMMSRFNASLASNVKTILCLAMVLAFLLFPAAAAFAETEVSGTISVNTTWTLSGSPYIVTGDVNFSNSAHLTIEPGVKIKFEPSTAIIVGYGYKGSLSAVGTEASPIVFTSNLASPVRGSWKGIYFDSETNDLKTVLEYCVVEYAGQDYKASIMCEDSYPAIRNCTVRYSANYPIRVEPEKVNLSGNIYENNKYQGTLIEGGTIYADTTWGNKGDESTYIVTGDVQFSDSAHLTIEPGVRIRFEPHTAIILGYGYKGSLSAIGTEASPIVFTSNLASPVPGSWKGIYFDSETNDLTTVLEYCIVEYAGQDYKASIICEESYPAIRNCTVRYSGTYPIRVEPQKMNLSGNTYTDNKKDGTLIEGGTIAADTTWGNKGDESKYIVIEDVKFSDSAHLTIEPGAEIRFESNTGILVGYGYNGSLSAVGTETSPIVFTSNLTSPVPGSWKGIYFYTNTLDAKSILEYCIVEYAGRNIYFDDASPTIRRNIIKNASDSGIYIQYSGSNSAVIDCNNISDNKFGIYLNSAAPQIVNNNFVNNQTGLHNNSSGAVTALNNWWNSTGGPGVNSSNGVYGNVTYSPWLTAQSNCISDPGTDKGYLQVTITPQEAITAGAQWCVNSTCYSSGTKAELSAGTYTVEFKTVSGWTKPANQTVTVTGGQTKAVAGAYTSSTSPKGYLQVTITPQDAVTAGAQWCVSGACYSSGTKTELSAGTYTVEFKAVSGWTKPANQSVSVTSGQTAALTGTYTKISGGGFVTRVLSCYTAGSKTTISLKTAPPTSTSSYAVEDTTPVNWTVSNISNSGTYDSVNRKVKYGPFFDSTARTLTYDVTPPAGETGDKTFTGTASADGVDSTVGGDSVISVCANNHPADTDKNFTLSISEVTAYGSAWKKGTTWTMPPNPIPISYLTRAGSLWKGGEKYKYNLASGEAPLCWINVTSSAREMSRSGASAAVSDMPEMYGAGETFTVSISVTPSSDVTVYALEDAVPAGWTVSSIDNSGSFDTVNSKVKYGPFFDNTARTFTYQITPPATAKGAYTFAGSASFDGVDIAVTGVRTVSDGTVVEIKGDVNGDGKLDLKDAIYILQVIIGLR